MTKNELTTAINNFKTETRDALQIMYDSMNNGQQKQIIKVEAVKTLFDRYDVQYQ